MRVIFVPVADRPECAAALNTAFRLAHRVGANVIGCHIRPHQNSPVNLSLERTKTGSVRKEIEWITAQKPAKGKNAQIRARELFVQFSEQYEFDLITRAGPRQGAVWMEKTGSPDKVIGIMGPMSDLIVLSRPATKGGAIAQMFLSASLQKSARPVLLMPQVNKPIVGNNICIAWNQSVEATRVVAATLPLLAQAEKVTIVTSGSESRAGPKSGQLAGYLKYWGIRSEHVSCKGKNEGTEIVEAFRASKSDLLIMGAYSRNRMSRMVFGGVTEHMLERTTVPVIMLHS
jgi:nucleotide-binding universal stress UspA family protein